MIFDFNFYLSILTGVLLPAIVALITVLLARVSEKRQNVLSITTNIRVQRNEQLKEAGILLLSNTLPRLLSASADKSFDMLQNATRANNIIGVILHRNFEKDVVIINLSDEICSLAFLISEAAQNSQKDELTELTNSIERLRQRFSFELDLYTNTDWYRIKKETSGKETTSADWFELNKELLESYPIKYRNSKEEK